MSWWETLHLVTWWKRLGISAIKTGQDAPSWIWCTERLSFLGGAISFYSVSCMSDVIFNPSLLNWSSLILTVAHIYIYIYIHSLYISYTETSLFSQILLRFPPPKFIPSKTGPDGGWTNPFEKSESNESNWIISPGIRLKHKKCLSCQHLVYHPSIPLWLLVYSQDRFLPGRPSIGLHGILNFHKNPGWRHL